ncbi:MAG: S49 family peptidase [Candidatus Dormibacteraeota bacterium]|nr:S49 family peptidase [Candidatus Dormibacteraeota bacterium]
MEEPTTLTQRVATLADRRRIGVIPVRGVIGGALRTDLLLKTIGAARRNRNIRAVVLEIDSPGGAAIASEALYVAVRKLAAAKPVVAWIRGVGASGAYFLACGATRIIAFPGAVVGSIGVISVRPVAAGLLQRIGARVVVTKTGRFKDLGAPWREPEPDDLAKEDQLVQAVFRRFTGAVALARGFDGPALERVTTGEVWLGADAVDLGLVDGTADDEDAALGAAQDLASLPHRKVQRMQPRRSLLQRAGLPLSGMGPPGERWLVELEGWLQTPAVRL